MKRLVMVLAAAVASVALSQEPSEKGTRMGSIEPVLRIAQNPKFAEKFGITEEQVAKLKALGKDRASMKEVHERIRKGMQRQTELLKAEKIDEAAVMASLDEVWEARKEIAKNQTKRLIAVRSILTPEQISKAREEVKAMREASRRDPKGEGKGRKQGRRFKTPAPAKETPEAAK